MILVKTKLGKSKIHGIGIFADQLIPKGSVVWKFQYPDLKVDTSELVKMDTPAKDQFLNYSYLSEKTNKYILCFDDARFFNHQDAPNCIDTVSSDGEEEGLTVAARDIQKGEELTCNYNDFDAEFDESEFR